MENLHKQFFVNLNFTYIEIDRSKTPSQYFSTNVKFGQFINFSTRHSQYFMLCSIYCLINPVSVHLVMISMTVGNV